MIEERWRYFAPGGTLLSGGPSTWFILDWDQRHMIAVTMNEEQDTEDVAVEHLKKHIHTLGTDVYAIHLSQDGELLSVSTDPNDDEMTCVYYPPLEVIKTSKPVKTVLRSDLLELDRLGPNVDLVSYVPGANTEARKVVFKYYFLSQFLQKRWHELNIWMRLPSHPNLVPFDRLVLDELHGGIVGFTSLYIPGGTIEDDMSRTFKLEWFRQLTHIVDDLNLKHGIVHQDIAARNLVVDPSTDALMLFDFNFSGQIGGISYFKDRDDVKGVIFTLYEIITHDMHFRQVPHSQQNPADVQDLEEWKQHPDVKLDHPVSTYRSVLNEWVNKRREGRQITMYTEAPEYIDWPSSPLASPKEQAVSGGHGNFTPFRPVIMSKVRRDERQNGVPTLDWERPAQIKLANGGRLFANGVFEDGK